MMKRTRNNCSHRMFYDSLIFLTTWTRRGRVAFFSFFYAPTWKYARWTPLPPSLSLRITFRNISRWNFDSWHLDSPLFASIVDLGWVLLILLLFWYKLFPRIVVYSQISYSHFVTSHANLKLNGAKIRINWLHNFSNKFELLRIELSYI